MDPHKLISAELALEQSASSWYQTILVIISVILVFVLYFEEQRGGITKHPYALGAIGTLFGLALATGVYTAIVFFERGNLLFKDQHSHHSRRVTRSALWYICFGLISVVCFIVILFQFFLNKIRK
jgi:hypothetical protein